MTFGPSGADVTTYLNFLAVVTEGNDTIHRMCMAAQRRRLAFATLFLATYGFIVTRAVVRLVLSEVNGSAMAFFLTVYLGTLLLVVVSLVVGWQNRQDSGWIVPVAGSAIVGSSICLLFYGA